MIKSFLEAYFEVLRHIYDVFCMKTDKDTIMKTESRVKE